MTLIHSGGICLKQLFYYDVVDIISCSHASKVSFVPLTQENQGNRVSLPIAPRPALMPDLTVKFWGQTETAPLSTHSYTPEHQKWLFPQQSEADAERTWTLSKTEPCIPLDSAFLAFKMHKQVCGCPANTLTEPALLHTLHIPLLQQWRHPRLQRKIIFVFFPDCSVKPLNPVSRVGKVEAD